MSNQSPVDLWKLCQANMRTFACVLDFPLVGANMAQNGGQLGTAVMN